MRILIVVVGKARGAVAEAIEHYEDRASRYWKLDVIEVPSERSSSNAPPDAVRDGEGRRLLARIPDELEVVALTRVGRGMGSTELARFLEEHGIRSSAGVAFAIGGAFGLGAAVLGRARRQLSLSPMTFPHEMARLVLAEQLYRAGTIIRREPYHKG